MQDTKYVGTQEYRHRQTGHQHDHYEKEKVETSLSYGMSLILNTKESWGKNITYSVKHSLCFANDILREES